MDLSNIVLLIHFFPNQPTLYCSLSPGSGLKKVGLGLTEAPVVGSAAVPDPMEAADWPPSWQSISTWWLKKVFGYARRVTLIGEDHSTSLLCWGKERLHLHFPSLCVCIPLHGLLPCRGKGA